MRPALIQGQQGVCAAILMATESAIKELQFDIPFKTVHNAKVKLWPVNVSGSRSSGQFEKMEMKASIYTALVEVAGTPKGTQHLR